MRPATSRDGRTARVTRAAALALAAFTLDAGAGAGARARDDAAAPESGAPATTRFFEQRALAGTYFRIDVLAHDEALARRAMQAAFAEIERLERVVSEWDSSSEVSAINAAAGRAAVPVSPELFGVLNRARWFSEMTDGAFDVSFAACATAWSVPARRIPAAAELRDCRALVDYRRVLLDPDGPTVRLATSGMRIGLGAIGKGYRVDRAAEVLEAHRIEAYAVNGGGDIRVSSGAGGAPWRIDIANPRAPGRSLATVRLGTGAIVTSADDSWYFEQDGVRHHHILDPRTGAPARGLAAVTVVAQRAIDADALATGLFVLGPERALALIGRLPGYHALLVEPDLALHATAGFPPIEPAVQGDR